VDGSVHNSSLVSRPILTNGSVGFGKPRCHRLVMNALMCRIRCPMMSRDPSYTTSYTTSYHGTPHSVFVSAPSPPRRSPRPPEARHGFSLLCTPPRTSPPPEQRPPSLARCCAWRLPSTPASAGRIPCTCVVHMCVSSEACCILRANHARARHVDAAVLGDGVDFVPSIERHLGEAGCYESVRYAVSSSVALRTFLKLRFEVLRGGDDVLGRDGGVVGGRVRGMWAECV
jgi:hypothetical protein